MNDLKPDINELVIRNYRDRLQEIEDTLRSIELRSGQGSNSAAAIAQMTEGEYQYIRKQAIVP